MLGQFSLNYSTYHTVETCNGENFMNFKVLWLFANIFSTKSYFSPICKSLFGSKHFIDFHKRCGWQVFNYQHLVFKGNVVYIYRIGT